jgi:raffinose synthase
MRSIGITSILLLWILPIWAQNITSNPFVSNNFGSPEIIFDGKENSTDFIINKKIINDVYIYSIQVQHPQQAGAKDSIGVYFADLKNVEGEVAIWRYKPWNSWAKPIALKSALLMPAYDVQFFYWKSKDGTYGAAVPLSGNGYRTTIGSQNNKWGSKAISLDAHEMEGTIPAMAIAFDKNPYKLFEKIYRGALLAMGRGEDLRIKKHYPEPFNYLGWCTWNSSEMGRNLSEDEVINGVKTFTDHHFPLGWVLIDDGWFQSKDGQLQSQLPDPKKFPNGFINMNARLKKDFGVKYTGIWHAFNGYWNGLDSDSEIGKEYKNDLFSWVQGSGTWLDTTTNNKIYYFIKPETKSLPKFYDDWYHYFKQQGFDFTKVDNQLVAERMALNNYPIFALSDNIHKAIYAASDKYFNGALINCMDMTPDAYLNFGTSAVARTEEDYFPYKKNEGYNLQEGNAAAHVLQAIYNSIYFSQMVYPDFDMFESNNPNAVFHAIARALNCGPIYITDKPGMQNFNILNALVYHDGKIIHSEKPLLPTADCLFQVQSKKIFKAFTSVNHIGLLGVFNAADSASVTGEFCAADVDNIAGNNFVIYEHFSKKLSVATKYHRYKVNLPRLGYKLYYIIPIKNGFAPLGLIEKYNAPATIIRQHNEAHKLEITLYEGGLFKCYCTSAPKSILINDRPFINYQFQNHIAIMMVPANSQTHPVITFNK